MAEASRFGRCFLDFAAAPPAPTASTRTKKRALTLPIGRIPLSLPADQHPKRQVTRRVTDLTLGPRKTLEAVIRPFRGPPLLEGAGPDGVGVAPGEHRDRVLGLLAQLLLVGPPDVPNHGLLVRADSALRQLRDLPGQLDGALQ